MRAPHTVALVLLLSIGGCTTDAIPAPRATKSAAINADKVGKPRKPGKSGTLVSLSNPQTVTYSIKFTSCHTKSKGELPDPKCTPGGIDPTVKQSNLSTTICRKGGYTDTVRPPTSQTNKAKAMLYEAYGIDPDAKGELDHLVSLQLGGDNDVANLWPEIGPIPNPKDAIETHLHTAVCNGKTTLSAAQHAIAENWETAEHDLGLK